MAAQNPVPSAARRRTDNARRKRGDSDSGAGPLASVAGFSNEPNKRIKSTLLRSHPYGVKPRGNMFIDALLSDTGRAASCRPGGLGPNWDRGCDDKTVIEIIRFVDANALLALCVTSRALYVFAHEEELWRALVLHAFASRPVTFHHNWKHTFAFCTLRDKRSAKRIATSNSNAAAAADSKSAYPANGCLGRAATAPAPPQVSGASPAVATAASAVASSDGASDAETAAILELIPPHVPLRVAGFYSDELFQVFLCSSLDVNAYAGGNSVPHREAASLSVQQFIDEFERPLKPVRISGLIRDWPAADGRWAKQRLCERFGSVVFKTGKTTMTLNDYYRYATQTREETPLYLFDNQFGEKVPQLLAEYTVPPYFRADYFALIDGAGPLNATAAAAAGSSSTAPGEADLDCDIGSGSDAEGGMMGGSSGPRVRGVVPRPSYRWILIGPLRSGSTFHKDPNATSAWNGLVSGRKKWIFYPPDVPPPGVYPSPDHGEVIAPVSVSDWLSTYYTPGHAASVGGYECIQEAGDVLFIPSCWWHLAVNLEESVAVTQNYVSDANVQDVLHYLHTWNKRALWTVLERRIASEHPNQWKVIAAERERRIAASAKAALLARTRRGAELRGTSLWDQMLAGDSSSGATPSAASSSSVAAAAAGGAMDDSATAFTFSSLPPQAADEESNIAAAADGDPVEDF